MKRNTSFLTPFGALLIVFTLVCGTARAQQMMLTSTPVSIENKSYGKEVDALVAHFDAKKKDIRPLLNDDRFEMYEGISKRFINSAEKRSPTLDEYKVILGYEGKRALIVDFMNSYATNLEAAEKEYGISKYVIAAIIGVESSFGRVTGRYNPFNVYVSMYAENYRKDFALAQLEELLKFVESRGVEIYEMKSSYAGAVTHAQFIPYSLNRWYVGDDINTMESSISSVANYLAHFKKITGSVEKAVYRYNPSQMYTSAVLDLAKDAEKLLQASK